LTFRRILAFDHPANGIVLNEVALIRRGQAFIYFVRKPLFIIEEAVARDFRRSSDFRFSLSITIAGSTYSPRSSEPSRRSSSSLNASLAELFRSDATLELYCEASRNLICASMASLPK